MHNCIQTEKLQPGMVIVQVTKQNGPLKIKKSGLVTSVEMIQGLLEMGIQEVQIDPNQTVEIETTVVQSSATMQLLQSNSGVPAKAEHQLHDQFNRSLFLPSVQDIPSQWQFYAKRSASLTGLIILGLVVGFAMAYLPSVLALRSPLVVSVPVAEVDKIAAKPLEQDPSVTATVVALDPPPASPVLANANNNVDSQPSKLTVEGVVKQIDISNPTEQTQGNTKLDIAQSPPTEVVQPTTPVKPEPLSADLLKRFEKVIQQMDREERYGSKNTEVQEAPANTGPIVDLSEFPILDEKGEVLSQQNRPTTVTKSKPEQDVPRIDQLPEWVIGELPSMAFSAHMYASVPSERWVRVNGQNMHEGDLIDNKVQIVHIAPQHVILNYAGHEFSMQAMTDW